MKLMRPNYYDIDHELVKKNYEGELEYLGTFETIKIGHLLDFADPPTAVYRNSKPNREKGHKDYLLIYSYAGTGYVSGLNEDEISRYILQVGLWCKECDDVIYSLHRHDNRRCSCKLVEVDGGRDYLKHNGAGVQVNINHLTGELYPQSLKAGSFDDE